MKILLATDGSKFSEAAVQSVTSQFSPGAKVRVLSVVEPISFTVPPEMSPRYYPELETQKAEAERLVRYTAKMLAQAGFDVSTCVATGDAKTCILEEAADCHANLIILGSHGRTGLARFLMGSVSEAVARHATCSVEIVRLQSADVAA